MFVCLWFLSLFLSCPNQSLVLLQINPMQRNSTGVAATYGLCFGRKATKLPTDHVLKVIKEKNISKMMLDCTDNRGSDILKAVSNDPVLSSRMKFVLWVRDLAPLANELSAKQWVSEYIEGYESIVSDICVGEVTVGCTFDIFNNAMQNLKSLLPASIKLSAMVNMSILEGTYYANMPPSLCKLTADARQLLTLLYTLNCGQFPLFVCMIPYFMMSGKAKPENCLLIDGAQTYMRDGQYNYTQVFNAMLDSIWCALNKELPELRMANLNAVSGWPTDGPKDEASPKNAKIYIPNFVKHSNKCTPRGNKPAGICIYNLVDEDLIETTVEEFKHFGAEPYLP